MNVYGIPSENLAVTLNEWSARYGGSGASTAAR